MTGHRLVGSQIENLTTERFVAFVNHLLQAERASQCLPLDGLTITSRINDKDGGVDARFIRANGSPFVASGDSVWQFKLSPPNQELIKEEVTKSGAAGTLAAGGHYYLVIGKDCSDQVVETRRHWLAEATGRPDRIHVYNASHLAEWVSWYPSVLVQHGFADHVREARSYSRWSEAGEHQSIFVQHEDRTALIGRMRGVLGASNTAVIRMEGAPGTGKTRLVLETLRPDHLAPLVVYAPQAEDLPSYVLADLSTARPATIAVLDECDRQVHTRLISALPSRSELRVITIGNDASVRDPDIEHVEVTRMDRFGLQRLISANFPDITDTQSGWLADAADGSIRLALTLARRIRAISEADLAELIGEGDVTQLLRLTLPTGERLVAAQVAALLRRFGWSDEHQSDINALARSSGLVPATFRACIEALTADGAIVRQGRMRYVSPLPLAVHLAARRWYAAPDAIAGQLLPTLSPEGQDALLARTADLGRYPPATTALSRLLGVGGPFGSLTAVENGWRASMLRYLAAINPEHTLLVLEIITGATIDQLKAATRSRRALVEASEKIAWNPPLFERAANVLVRLALAENEAMTNNASGAFAQLFSATLPGTAARPAARLTYLKALTDAPSEQQLRLVLSAVNCGLSGPQTRLMTAEQQYGHAAPPPGVPATAVEFQHYVGGLMDVLRILIASETDVSNPALTSALRAVRVFLGTPAEDQVVDLVEWIARREPRAVRVSSHEWRRFREHDGGTPQAWKRLDTVLACIEPTDPIERLIDLTARSPWSIATQQGEASAAYITELQAIRHVGRLADALTALPAMPPPASGLLAIALAATAYDAEADWAILTEHSTDPYVLGVYLYHLEHASHRDTLIDTAHTQNQISDTDAAYLSLVTHYCEPALRRLHRLLDAGLSPAAARAGLLFSSWLPTLGLRKFSALYRSLHRAAKTDEDAAVLVEVLHRHLDATPAHLPGLSGPVTAAVLDYPVGNSAVVTSLDSWFALARVITAQCAAAIARKIFTLAIKDRINLLPINEVGELVMLCTREEPAGVWEVAAELSMGPDGYRLIHRIASWLINEMPDRLVRRWIEDNPADQPSRALIAAKLAPVHGDQPSDLVEYLLTTFPHDVHHAIEANLWTNNRAGPRPLTTTIAMQINQLHSWARHSPQLQAWAHQRIHTLQQRLLDAHQAEIETQLTTSQTWQ